jgi:DNA-binding NtrC family response regulator
MAGESAAFRRVLEAVGRLRDQDVPVLIRGETGTGKDLLARAIHGTSSRRGGPFLAVHSAALPDELFEAEVFGHEAGAFTGADAARPGLLETLAGGSLLLDDVHHLTPRAQAKLLHVLGSGRARRLGSAVEYRVDVRFLASTSADLRAEVARGAFRGDLYFRLAAIEIALPPLRERLEDLPILARHLLERHAARMERPVPALGPDALDLLARHDWPGNVRELETVLLRALLGLSGSARIGADDLRPVLPRGEREDRVPEELMSGRSLKDFRRRMERAYVQRAFREAGGDLKALMAALGVKRTQLYALFRRLGVDLKTLRGRPPGR